MILIDSNVLIDIIENDPDWCAWSSEQLALVSETDRICITPVVVAEVGPKFASLDAFCNAIDDLMVVIEPLTNEAAFIAGQAFRAHRRMREGSRSIIADFIIGGQASASGARILTRDTGIYTRHFPKVSLISPEKATR